MQTTMMHRLHEVNQTTTWHPVHMLILRILLSNTYMKIKVLDNRETEPKDCDKDKFLQTIHLF